MQSGKITAIIQARTDSERFPNKVLEKIENRPMIWHVINRIKASNLLETVVLATTEKKEDEILLKIANDCDIHSFAGADQDVLKRFYDCAFEFQGDPIVRITGDCPVIDSCILDEIITYFLKNDYDYVSNTLDPTYPDGFDVEIFSFKALKKAYENAKLRSEREHVTPFIKNNPKLFPVFNYCNNNDISHIRLTVDEECDLKVIKKIFSEMRPNLLFGIQEIIELINKNPKILELNKDIQRNEGYLKSLKNDKVIK